MSILATELEWPEGTKFFEVQCRLGVWDVDGWDLDKEPEVKTLGGTVRITPRTPAGRIRLLEPDGKYRVVVAPPLTFAINEFTGKLVNTADNTEGVWVVDPSSDTVDPKDFTYSAVVTPKVGSPFTVEFDGTVAINGVYDLANGTTVAPSRGVSVLESRITKLEQETSGGFYINERRQKVDYVMVVSDTDPGKTRVIDGKTYEVWWIQTEPPDPNQWVPAVPTMNAAQRSYTIPRDAGATYTVGGVAKAYGTHTVDNTAQTLAWQAVEKSGYTFKSGATTSGSFVFPAWTPTVGTVLMSDSFNRADGALVGTQSDSFEGGVPHTWTSNLGAGGITDGAVSPSETFFQPSWSYPSPQENVRVEFSWKTVGTMSSISLGTTTGGTIQLRPHEVYASVSGDGNKWFTKPLPKASPGDHIVIHSTTTIDGYRQWTVENRTTGGKQTGTTQPALGNQTDGALDATGWKITGLTIALRGDDSPIGELDWIKVVQA